MRHRDAKTSSIAECRLGKSQFTLEQRARLAAGHPDTVAAGADPELEITVMLYVEGRTIRGASHAQYTAETGAG